MVALSDYEYMRNIRLPNWGRWGRQDVDKPDPERGTANIYNMGRADREGVGDEAPEPPPAAIDQRDAEYLDRLIGNRIGRTHRHVICGYFYKRNESFRHKVPEAIRALLDADYLTQGAA